MDQSKSKFKCCCSYDARTFILRYTDHKAIIDCNKALIPTVAIVDSDCNPNIVTYPVPGNDDTIESVQLYLHLFKQAVLLGKQHKQKLEESQ